MKRLVSALLLLSAASFFAADSIQLLSDPGMKTASGWKAFGKNAVRKNTRTLVLSKPAGAERNAAHGVQYRDPRETAFGTVHPDI